MRDETTKTEEQLKVSQVLDTEKFDSSSDEHATLEEPLPSPTILSESSSGAVLKELSKQDDDRPDLGPFQWLVIAALIVKKVILICLLVTVIGWMFY